MTISPFKIYELMHLYDRISKVRNPGTVTSPLREGPVGGEVTVPSGEVPVEKTIFWGGTEMEEPKDVVHISSEAKRRQIIEETKKEVLEKIRE